MYVLKTSTYTQNAKHKLRRPKTQSQSRIINCRKIHHSIEYFNNVYMVDEIECTKIYNI